MFKDKKVLVTGSNGLIGKELVLLLKEQGADVFEFDIKRTWGDEKAWPCYECGSKQGLAVPMDIRSYHIVKEVFGAFKPEFVFHLFGIKGNPKKTKERPADFMVPMLIGDTNIIKACTEFGVKRMLYTSSIAVENMQTDFYPATAKMTAEILIGAMRVQHPETQFCIVRPANVYGRFDNFENPDAMVVTSLISKAMKNGYVEIWGAGSQVRDFINAKDVAKGMIKAMEEMPKDPVNLCSGKGYSIAHVAGIIRDELEVPLTNIAKEVLGDQSRVMKLNWDFKPEISLEEGIKEVCQWVKSGNQA